MRKRRPAGGCLCERVVPVPPPKPGGFAIGSRRPDVGTGREVGCHLATPPRRKGSRRSGRPTAHHRRRNQKSSRTALIGPVCAVHEGKLSATLPRTQTSSRSGRPTAHHRRRNQKSSRTPLIGPVCAVHQGKLSATRTQTSSRSGRPTVLSRSGWPKAHYRHRFILKLPSLLPTTVTPPSSSVRWSPAPSARSRAMTPGSGCP